MAVRAAIVLVAVLAAGWLGVQAVGSAALADATALAFRPEPSPAPSEVAAALADARRAGRLNPDIRPDLARAVLYARGGQAPRALAILREVTAREPRNVEGWALLARLAETADPALAARARARLRSLAPPVPAP